MQETMEARADERLDDRTALEVMGWIRGGPDEEFWVLPDPPAGLASVFRMPVTRWRPTRDVFCRELLVEELRSRSLGVEIEEELEEGRRTWRCTIAPSEDSAPTVAVSAPSAGMAVVCAALAYCGRRD